jgi:hypothetical protein
METWQATAKYEGNKTATLIEIFINLNYTSVSVIFIRDTLFL